MRLDSGSIRQALNNATAEKLAVLEVFDEIDSTNTYLMHKPAPQPGKIRVAVTDNQTAGRGRHGRTWQSPPGSGICLSMAYCFASSPANLPALTLAIGIGTLASLKSLGVNRVQLKWPNDLIMSDGKLGGILTEAQAQSGGAVMVVTGLGLNIDMSAQPELLADTTWARPVIDLQSRPVELPARNAIAASLIEALCKVMVVYERDGFAQFSREWQDHDWLFGKAVTVETGERRISGIAAGVSDDGALLIDTQEAGVLKITSGTVQTETLEERAS